jgi:hypothetical protein
MAATSALLKAPKSVMIPATIQTLMSKRGDPNCEAIRAGFINIPEPITPPTTNATVVFSDKLLLNPLIC